MATVSDPTQPDTALPARRRSELLRLVQERGQGTVIELAELFGVSLDTIRRDLDFLAQRGLLSRTHGGAVPAEALVGHDAPFSQRLTARKEAKALIARAAAQLISDGETLIVNGGSTTLSFAAQLGERRGLTIVTNSLTLPSVLPMQAIRDVYMLGGQIRWESQVTLGAVGFADAGRINADTAVIGVGGVTPSGFSTTLLAEASMIAAMVATARRTIVLADSGKFGHNAFAHILPLDQMHILITDCPPPNELASALAEAKVDVITPD